MSAQRTTSPLHFIHITVIRGKTMVDRVKWPVGWSKKRPLALSETQADKERVQTHLTQGAANERAQ